MWPFRFTAILLMVVAVGIGGNEVVSPAQADTLLFDFEPPPDPNLQGWITGPGGLLTTSPTGATDGMRALSITTTNPATLGTYVNVAAVSIPDGDPELASQFAALEDMLDAGGERFELDMDVTYADALIPPTSFIALSLGLRVGNATNDTVYDLAVAGDGGGGVPNQSFRLSIPISTIPVNTLDNVLSVPGQLVPGASFAFTIGLDGDWATGPATIFIDRIRLRQLTPSPRLTLEVNQSTGEARIKNDPLLSGTTESITFDYYEIRSTLPLLSTDFNRDGTVNAADFTVWRDNLGLTDSATQADGDANDDGDVTLDDYDLWKAEFGQPSGGYGTSLSLDGWNSLDEQNIDAVDGTDAGEVAGDSILEGWDQSGSGSPANLSEAFLLGSSTLTTNEWFSLGNSFVPGAAQNLTFLYRTPSRPTLLRSGIVHYINGPGGGATGVPEPATFISACLAMILLGRQRTRLSTSTFFVRGE